MLPSPTVYEIGDTFDLGNSTYQVVGVGPDRLCARDVDTSQVMFFTALDLLPEPGLGSSPTGFNPLEPTTALLAVPEGDRPLVQFWMAHLEEIESGVHPDRPNIQDPDYSRDRSRRERIAAKAEELSSVRWPDGRHRAVSRRTVERKQRAYRERGPAGLVSGHHRLAKPGGNQDPEFIRILDEVLSGYITLTDVPFTVLFGRIRIAFRSQHPENDYWDEEAPNHYAFPSYSTVYRLIQRRGAHLLVDKPAKTRQSAASTPTTPYRPTVALRPGAETQGDTMVFDLWSLDESRRAVRPRLSALIDKRTRTLSSWIITLGDPNGQALGIMVAESLVPYPLIDGMSERYNLVNSRLPARKMIALDRRLAAAQARPLIPPDRIVLDNGSAYRGGVFDDITTAFGISITWCNPRAPYEKGIIERFFRTVNQSFCAYFWSYLGVSPEHRGKIAATQLSITIDMVRELFAEWVLLVYHYRPHDSLCDPMTPKRKLSPIQAYEASLAYAPRFAVPLTSRMFYRAYPVRWQKIGADGVRVDSHIYDSDDELDDLRHKPSGVVAHGDLWEIRFNPHNRACVWLHKPDVDEWVLLPCVRYRESELPCSDQWWNSDLGDDPDLYRRTEELHARSADESRLLTRKRAVERDRKRLHDSTHLPMPATKNSDEDEDEDVEGVGSLEDSANETPAAGGYAASNKSPWSV
ncbi:hypothetical protein A5766_19965 [Gordonia sp. 852002-51296_SCH5728562-b]|nr:hypothetical protein A5766_19965 [Gordonia sp. 852002-51296_SCH5728562-b]